MFVFVFVSFSVDDAIFSAFKKLAPDEMVVLEGVY
jgi:hypothetical protein